MSEPRMKYDGREPEPRMIDPRDLSISYDADADFLYIQWSKEPGVYDGTDDDHILNRFNDDDELVGVMIQGTRTIGRGPITLTLDERGARKMVRVKVAAEEMGVSIRRVNQLLADGRIRGASKVGDTWLVPSPVDLVPGTRGPKGVAGKGKRRRSKTATVSE